MLISYVSPIISSLWQMSIKVGGLLLDITFTVLCCHIQHHLFKVGYVLFISICCNTNLLIAEAPPGNGQQPFFDSKIRNKPLLAVVLWLSRWILSVFQTIYLRQFTHKWVLFVAGNAASKGTGKILNNSSI